MIATRLTFGHPTIRTNHIRKPKPVPTTRPNTTTRSGGPGRTRLLFVTLKKT